MKRLLILPLLALLCMQACKKDEPADEQPAAATPADYFFPLKVGNYWVYETVNTGGGSNAIDTIKIIGDTLISGKTFYRINTLFPIVLAGSGERLLADSSGYLVDVGGGVFNVNDGTRDTIGGQNYDAVETVIKTGNRDTVVNVTAGSFHSLETVTDVYYANNGSPTSQNPRHMYEYWSKSVGCVKRTYFYASAPYESILTLKAYHLEP